MAGTLKCCEMCYLRLGCYYIANIYFIGISSSIWKKIISIFYIQFLDLKYPSTEYTQDAHSIWRIAEWLVLLNFGIVCFQMKWILLSLLPELTNRNYLTMSFGPHFYSKHVSILILALQWTKYKNQGKSPTANAYLALPKCFQKKKKYERNTTSIFGDGSCKRRKICSPK